MLTKLTGSGAQKAMAAKDDLTEAFRRAAKLLGDLSLRGLQAWRDWMPESWKTH